MRTIEKTPYFSKTIGKLPKGCQLCVEGAKMVLYVTGICNNNCAYCPLSASRKKDRMWADEWPVDNIEEMTEECRLIDAKGCGITGGDPLVRLDRTVECIKHLKKVFGKDFHIHLYTPLLLVTEEKLERLYNAGLDEIRFHPDFDNDKDWNKITFAKKYDWDIGIEIPVFPDRVTKTKEMIDAVKSNITFVNLNELEISETNAEKLYDAGYSVKDDGSYAVVGCDVAAKKIMEHVAKNTKLKCHYCSLKLKDKVQLANRLKRRAENVALEGDYTTDEGLLFRGAVYAKEPSFASDFNFTADDEKLLDKCKKELIDEFDVPVELLVIDKIRGRLLTSVQVVSELSKEIKSTKCIPTTVIEYPTYDAMIVELEKL
jgi:uncharacterized protein